MQNQTASVYGLVDPRRQDTQLVFYVGMSEEPYRRYGEHLLIRGEVKQGSKSSRILEMRNEGILPVLVIFEKNIPTNIAQEREKYWIEYYFALGMPLTNKVHAHVKPVPRLNSPCTLRLQIKEVAERQGMNRSQLQLKSGVTLPLLSRYWHNKTIEVKLDALERIADALGVEANSLIVGDEDE